MIHTHPSIDSGYEGDDSFKDTLELVLDKSKAEIGRCVYLTSLSTLPYLLSPLPPSLSLLSHTHTHTHTHNNRIDVTHYAAVYLWLGWFNFYITLILSVPLMVLYPPLWDVGKYPFLAIIAVLSVSAFASGRCHCHRIR
jgi:hypothetical protein